jgi:hypothetical protein
MLAFIFDSLHNLSHVSNHHELRRANMTVSIYIILTLFLSTMSFASGACPNFSGTFTPTNFEGEWLDNNKPVLITITQIKDNCSSTSIQKRYSSNKTDTQEIAIDDLCHFPALQGGFICTHSYYNTQSALIVDYIDISESDLKREQLLEFDKKGNLLFIIKDRNAGGWDTRYFTAVKQ